MTKSTHLLVQALGGLAIVPECECLYNWAAPPSALVGLASGRFPSGPGP